MASSTLLEGECLRAAPSFYDHTSPSAPKWGPQGAKRNRSKKGNKKLKGKKLESLTEFLQSLALSVGECFKNTSDKSAPEKQFFAHSSPTFRKLNLFLSFN